ncbi:uncharacterized protein RJT20DRAFT_149832 [Scheffersomyces xylosifermentans]|uniref:uncharacterized protein n=1 Tax=Scheffersomyces xylosifermentans TaxID=1304137 RepID=UPI00315CB4CE
MAGILSRKHKRDSTTSSIPKSNSSQSLQNSTNNVNSVLRASRHRSNSSVNNTNNPPSTPQSGTNTNISSISSGSNGFLSSILNAAHNAANNIISTTVEEEEKLARTTSSASGATSIGELHITPTHSHKKEHKEHSFSNRLDFLLRPAKFNSSKSSVESDELNLVTPDGVKTEQEDQEIQENDEVHSVNGEGSALSTANVQFASVRESPLNTMGQGDLSLAVFDTVKKQTTNPQLIDSSLSKFPSVGGDSKADQKTKNVHSSPSRSIENLAETKRSLSPDLINRQIALTGPNGVGESKRSHRKSFNATDANVTSNTASKKVSSPSGESKSRSTDFEDSEELDSGSESGSDHEEGEQVDYSNLKYASRKRNKEFHVLFRKLPSSDPLIDDFSCALSKDILVQGRMYLSSHYICFNSNILGWVTNLVISLQEVIQIEKKSTAVLFPNGMIIRTLHHKYVFATFLSRDSTFNLITNVWHKVLLENSDDGNKLFVKRRARGNSRSTGASKSVSRERYGDLASNSITDDYESDDESHGDILSNDHDEGQDDDDGSFSSLSLHSDTNQDHGSDEASSGDDNDTSGVEKSAVHEDSPATSGGSTPGSGTTFKGFPVVGPLTHSPTELTYTKQPNDTFISDGNLKAPIGVVFSILFGADTSLFIKILKKQKNFDITESEITGLGPKNKERHYSYIKPLGGAIGPKQTKCLIVDKIITFQPDNFILVEQTTSTPDVPSGGSFSVKTKMYFCWAENNSTRFYVVTSIEWTGKSWIKGAIEKGSIDGQKESMKQTMESLEEMISAGNGSGGKSKTVKSKKKGRSRKNTVVSKASEEKSEPVKEKTLKEKFVDFVETLGKSVPIPYLSELVTGSLIIFVGLIFTFKIFNYITGSGTPQQVQILGGESYVSKIKINDQKYLVIPSVESNFAHRKIVMENEVNLWNWIKDRSEEKISVTGDDANASKYKGGVSNEYSDQEIREIVKLTQMKLDQLTEKLNL